MPRSRLETPRLSTWVLRRAGSCVLVLSVAMVAGCGNSCFVGFSNNGNGGLIIKAGNPPPACSLPQTNGMMSVRVLKPLAFEFGGAALPQHAFVTLQGVQLHSSDIADLASPDWIEIAPRLRAEPLQIDLIGGSVSELLVDSAAIPAGTYRQIRLRFLPDSSESGGKLLSQNACGEAHRNCIVTADGRIDTLAWAAEIPDILITGDAIQSGSLVLLPEAKMDVLLTFELSRMLYSSAAEPLKLRTFLAGHAAAR